MGVRALWQASATALILLIVVNLLLAGLNETAWIVLGLLALLVMGFYCFRQGQGIGHGACGVSNTIESARQAGDKVFAQLDKKYLAQAFSPITGIRGVLAGALIPYLVNCVYVIMTLISRVFPVISSSVLFARIPAWLLSLPFWPLVMHWHEDFVALTPDIAAMLLITPFVLPLCVFAGYMRGPKLWAHSEDVMRQGLRRAKARSRVGKKMVPKVQKPEI